MHITLYANEVDSNPIKLYHFNSTVHTATRPTDSYRRKCSSYMNHLHIKHLRYGNFDCVLEVFHMLLYSSFVILISC